MFNFQLCQIAGSYLHKCIKRLISAQRKTFDKGVRMIQKPEVTSPAKNKNWVPGIVAAIIVLTACIEWKMGRSWFGPDGKFGFWESDIWSAECSQRFVDPYSFTHLVHGFLFFGLLWLIARRVPLRYRYLTAVFFETAWEILENSPLIINRYREATMAIGYVGDSILNSMSDILMMSLGFLIASRIPWWASALIVLMLEIGCAFVIRDNLSLDILMLIHPIDAIKKWQMAGHVAV